MELGSQRFHSTINIFATRDASTLPACKRGAAASGAASQGPCRRIEYRRLCVEYRGSPLCISGAKTLCSSLSSTRIAPRRAFWGSQQLGLSTGANRDGVFAIWYATEAEQRTTGI